MRYFPPVFDYNGLVARKEPPAFVFVDEVDHPACRDCKQPFRGKRASKRCASCAPAAKARITARNNRKTSERRRTSRLR